VDGLVSTGWRQIGFGSSIEIDLGNQRTVCSIDIAWHNGYPGAYQFDISISNPGYPFTRVYSGTSGGTNNIFEEYDLGGIVAKYIRLTVNENIEDEVAGINEIKVNGY
jgi:hypothetical protein